jgi:trehalose 6-phosphate phosphatase
VTAAGKVGGVADDSASDAGSVPDVDSVSGTVPGALPSGLRQALGVLAARPTILVAVDFDGVLAPIVDDPDAARPLPASARAVRRLADLPGVRLALVSGRTLGDLRLLADPPPVAMLVGSHGAQFAAAWSSSTEADPGAPRAEADTVPGLDEQAQTLLARVVAALDQISGRHPGTFVEHKPAGAVLHTRRAARQVARRAADEALSGPAAWSGVHLTRGKEVLDLSVVDANKGVALSALRVQAGLAPRSGGVLYIGDDVTDERAFAALDDDRGDVTVKVGDGQTIARYRIADPQAVTDVLDHLVRLRTR